MRILHLIPTIDRQSGGPASALLGMAKAQASSGLDVTVLAGYRAGETGLEAEVGQVKLRRIGPCAGPLGRVKGLSEAVADGVANADVVHLHGIWEEIQHLGGRHARAARVPYVVTAHGMLDDWALRQSRLKKRLYMLWRGRRSLHRAAAIHCTSRAEARQIDRQGRGVPTFVEPLGIDWSEFEHLPGRGAFRAAYPQIGDRPLIVFVGRVHPGKGVEHLIPALAACPEKRAVAAVIGPDSRGFRGRMEQLATACGVRDRVIFTGMLTGEKKIQALVDADLFALPSDHENFGMSVVEALAAGTPVVISPEVNIQQEVADAGVGGVCPRTPGALAHSLAAWLTDESMRRNAASRARSFVLEHFDWRAIARHWKDRYAGLANRRAISPQAVGGAR